MSSEPPLRFVFSAQAKADIDRLPAAVKKDIGHKLQQYLDSDDPLHFAKRLVNAKVGSWRFRAGNYRILFDLVGSEIQVLRVRDRKDVYS